MTSVLKLLEAVLTKLQERPALSVVTRPKLSTLVKLAKALGVPVMELLE